MGNLKDYATSTVSVAPSPGDSGTTLEVQTGHGSRYPSTPFSATAHPPFEFPTLDNSEKLLVTNVTDDTLTITRAQGDTTAKDIQAGWRVSNAVFFDDIPEVIDEDSMASNSDDKVPTQQSVKAYVDAAITAAKEALMPVGTIVVLGVSTNPNTLYGFGTWTRIQGRVVVGVSDTDTDFDLNDTGGAKTHTLTIGEIPRHNHKYGSKSPNNLAATGAQHGTAINVEGYNTTSVGGGQAHNNMQPYIAKYVWERTA